MAKYFLPSNDERASPPLALPLSDTGLAPGPTGTQRSSPLRAVLQRRLGSMLFGFGVVVALVAAISFTLPPRYESTASFLIEESSSGTGSSTALAVLEKLGHSRSAETEIALLRSHSVLEPVTDALDLHVTARMRRATVRPDSVLPSFSASATALPGEYTVTPADSAFYEVAGPGATTHSHAAGAMVALEGVSFTLPGARWTEPIKLNIAPFGRVIEQVRRRLRVRQADANAEVILLTCQGRTAVAAQQLCAQVSNSYLQLRSTLQHVEAGAAATFLDEQVAQVAGQLKAAEEQLRAYALSNRAVALDTRARGEVEHVIDVKAQREALAAELDALQSLMAEIESGPTGAVDYRRLASFPTFMKSQNQVVAQLLESLVQLENRRSDLALRRSEQNPDLAAVNQRITEIQTQLRSIAGTYKQGLGAQITSLDATLARARQQLDVIPSQEIESARLRRQVTLLEELYTFLQTRLHEAEVARAVNLPSVRIVDRATLPFRTTAPNIPLNLGLAVVLGIGFGLIFGLYREYSDTRIYERQEVERGLGLPVLGMVARLAAPGPIQTQPAAPPTPARALSRDHVRVRQMEIAWEAFHGLATELRFARAGSTEGKPRSIAITSTSRGEGKTLTACNLAVAWSSYPARTLLIDADLRAGAVARFFSLSGLAPGVAEVLAGTASAESAIRVIEPTAGAQLHVLSAGAYPGRAAELFDTTQLDELLRWAETQFDVVIVDTPPLNVLSDSAAVAARVDAVLVVVRGGLTDRNALDVTLRRLERAGGHIEGIVLNDVELPSYYVHYSRLAVRT